MHLVKDRAAPNSHTQAASHTHTHYHITGRQHESRPTHTLRTFEIPNEHIILFDRGNGKIQKNRTTLLLIWTTYPTPSIRFYTGHYLRYTYTHTS